MSEIHDVTSRLFKEFKHIRKKKVIIPQIWKYEKNKYKKINSSRSNKACILLDSTFKGFIYDDLYRFSDINIFSIKGVINKNGKDYTIFDYTPIDELPSVYDNFEIIIYEDPYAGQFSVDNMLQSLFESIFSYDNLFIILLIIIVLVLTFLRPTNTKMLTY